MARNGPLPGCEPGELGDRAGGGQATPAGSGQEMSMSYLPKVLSVLVAPLVLVGLAASSGTAATAATPTFFGAKLTTQSQPSNAQNGQSCDESAGIPSGSTCTWVAITAFENGSHFTAPRTGTVRHVKLVSCVKGKFRLQLARANPGADKAKVVKQGPKISYHGQSPCGGASGDHYIVQSFKVHLHVTKGDYIVIKAASTGTLSCSGGDGFLLYAPPLPVGGPFKKTHSGASCDLLVQLSYR
jgi:hypothetical protein